MTMAKSKKTKPVALKRKIDPEQRKRLRRVAIQVSCVLAVILGSAAAVKYSHRYVDRKLAFFNHAPKIMLKDRPAWMSDFLAEQIAASAQPVGAYSTFDHQ